MSKAIIKAMEERLRQIDDEGFTGEHDDAYIQGTLSNAAECYARAAKLMLQQTLDSELPATPMNWPWHRSWWKPSPDPKRNIIKAMALLAAEYDRIERYEAPDANTVSISKTVWSTNDEEFNYDELEGLVYDHELKAGETVYKGEAVKHLPSAFAVRTALSVIDGLQDEAHNFADEASEGFADCSKPQINLLQSLIDAWADATLTVDFYGITGTQQYTITTEDVEASQ
ncbi:hypothetical protein [Vreelandella maris]|uniref:hypothetical protein n=1 Tax=Vreelandella maris TaxID=2729617 RepID=UPI0030EF5DE8